MSLHLGPKPTRDKLETLTPARNIVGSNFQGGCQTWWRGGGSAAIQNISPGIKKNGQTEAIRSDTSDITELCLSSKRKDSIIVGD